MTIESYKSCRELRKQFQGTNLKLQISYTYTKYTSIEIAIPVIELLTYFHFGFNTPDSSRIGRKFTFQRLKSHRNMPAI